MSPTRLISAVKSRWQPALPASRNTLLALMAVKLVATLAVLSFGLVLAPQTSHAADASATAADTATPASAAAYADALASFNRALAGQESAVGTALSQWSALMAAEPGNPVPRAYTGAATALQARTTLLPWKKLGFADDGLALIDKALGQLTPAHDTQLQGGVPASLLVRFTAAGTFNAMPAMFNRGDRGARLMDEVLKSPLLAASPLGFRAAVWQRAADDATKAQRPTDARQWLEKIAASGAPQAADAQARLKAL